MDGKTLRFIVAVAALATAIFLLLLWQPVRQVRLHQRNFLRAVEKRDWTKAGRFIAAQYHDRWEHDKENVLPEAAQVFSHFFVCSLQGEERTITVADGAGTITTRLTLGGSGSAIAEYAKQRVNALSDPFTFKWIHQTWKPWDWALVEVDHPQLEIEGSL